MVNCTGGNTSAGEVVVMIKYRKVSSPNRDGVDVETVEKARRSGCLI